MKTHNHLIFFLAAWVLVLFAPMGSNATMDLSCLNGLDRADAVLIMAPDGRMMVGKNETASYIPASTLKVLTALTAIHHLGPSFRFQTEFFTDSGGNLKIKGYGDPLLTSEVWQAMAGFLVQKIQGFNDLILDDSFFSKDIRVPDKGMSSNPYDAPNGALCANFNTVFFDHDQYGRIISAEPQTPLTPLAKAKISTAGIRKGRFTFTHDATVAARYAGELFLVFTAKKGGIHDGSIRMGVVNHGDEPVYTHFSPSTLSDVIQKMMTFSNNFIANQLVIALGAHVHGPPGTLEKGVSVIQEYARTELGLKTVRIVEGSGISRQNRISPMDMAVVLDRFKLFRRLLKRSGQTSFKTGTLKGIQTRVGYIESSTENPYVFVVFLNHGSGNVESLVSCLEKALVD